MAVECRDVVALTLPPLRGSFPLPEGEGDCFHDALRIGEDVIVPEAQDGEALRLQKFGAAGVIGCRFRMLAAIHLDHQLRSETEEIGEIGADRNLPPPF